MRKIITLNKLKNDSRIKLLVRYLIIVFIILLFFASYYLINNKVKKKIEDKNKEIEIKNEELFNDNKSYEEIEEISIYGKVDNIIIYEDINNASNNDSNNDINNNPNDDINNHIKVMIMLKDGNVYEAKFVKTLLYTKVQDMLHIGDEIKFAGEIKSKYLEISKIYEIITLKDRN